MSLWDIHERDIKRDKPEAGEPVEAEAEEPEVPKPVKAEAGVPVATGTIGQALSILAEVMSPGERLSVWMLPRTRIPPGGGLAWELSDGVTVPEVVGVIVHRHVVRAYWSTATPTKGQPPSCYSLDLVVGHGEPGGACDDCPYSKWGSAVGADGKVRAGQACKVITRLFLLVENEMLPLFLPLPPSASKAETRYLLRLSSKGLRLWQVVTGISLQRVQSRDGITYSEPSFRMVRVLDEQERQAVQAYRMRLLEVLSGEVTPEEAEALDAEI